ncbi:hypothetical protein BOTCAL_0695g00030 [Botryotinia calthae]|uniref:Uncharacterized protein n=1 Tax=Botryotinia calthae TaxID=38488 RepID=A0A4Y8CI02_9HELO|nr:hypothetical protein BOTCAL_0695g00030 [Botryotinia calthae]
MESISNDRAASLPTSDRRDTDTTQLMRPASQCDPDEEEFRTIIEKAAAKVRKGLKSPTRASTFPKLSDPNALCDNVRDYEEYLWAQDLIPGIASKKLQWSSRFLACCFRLFRINQKAESRTNNTSNNFSLRKKLRKDTEKTAKTALIAECASMEIFC